MRDCVCKREREREIEFDVRGLKIERLKNKSERGRDFFQISPGEYDLLHFTI